MLLIARPGSIAQLIAGFLFSLAGETIRIWSSGHIRKGKEIITSGPYARTRNPLYLGSLLVGFGFCVASTSFDNPLRTVIIWLYFALGFCLIYIIQVSREEKVLSEKFPGEFEKYRNEVPAFIPALTAYGRKGKNKFNFNLFRENSEYRFILVIAVVYLVLLSKLLF